MTVIQFPVKKQIELSKKHKKGIKKYAKRYIALLQDICDDLEVTKTTDEEFDDIFNLVLTEVMLGFNEAIHEEFETD